MSSEAPFLVWPPAAARERVRLCYRPAAGARPGAVALFGEMGDWLAARPLTPLPDAGGDGGFETHLELPSGLYQYQLEVDGERIVDPSCPRTRSHHGRRNSVLSVGGTLEPLLFAPSAGCLWLEEPGVLVVQACLRLGHGERVTVCWSERPDGALTHRAPMAPIAQEDEHLVLRARLPLGCARARFCFELADGSLRSAGGGEAPFVWDAAQAPGLPPSSWHGAVFYTIFVDRFRPALDSPDWSSRGGRNVGAGGHLAGIERSLPELADLGVTVLYLTPVHVAESCHRYDLVDPLRVDPALGGEEAFARLLASAHARGLRIVVDLSFSHAGRGFPPYEDVLRLGRGSPCADMFLWEPGPDGALRTYGRRKLSPLLDPGHPAVRQLALDSARRLVELGVDGFRLDAAAEVPHELGRALRALLRAARPDGIVLGEVVPAHAWRWRDEGCVDVATDFGFHEALTALVAERSLGAADAWQRIVESEIARGGADWCHLRFLSTHDHPRFATLCRRHADRTRAGLGTLLWLSCAGLPALLYGEEVGLSADVAVLEPEAVWDDRAPMPWQPAERDGQQRALVRRLLALRAASPALQRGRTELAFAEGAQLVLRRAAGGETIDLAVNASDEPVELELEDDELDELEPLATTGAVTVRAATVSLGPNGGLLARRRRSPARLAARVRQVRSNRGHIESDFEQARCATHARPRHIDFSVTERCNLRCRHCLNSSPSRTADRSAREMPEAVLDALRDDLAFVDYCGFVHGGESLTSPMLERTLSALRDARQGERTEVHLLSNGMLLTLDRVERLVALGLSSLAVSVDGARPETNDLLREGARLEQIFAHVAAIVGHRRATGIDLRIGLSLVVMARNLGELDELMDRAAALGVDWVKLEELVACTDAARDEQVPLGSPATAAALQRAAERGRRAGLVVVEHVTPPVVWRCQLAASPAMASFLAADEHANRATIHPCRAFWEQACIDPSGDVRVASFLGPVIGNVLAEPLAAIWAGSLARAERERASRAWPCGGRPERCGHRLGS